MVKENTDRGVYVDTRTRGQGRAGQEEKKEKEEGWKSANENENPHTEVVGNIPFQETIIWSQSWICVEIQYLDFHIFENI